jgi:hypothetical protein
MAKRNSGVSISGHATVQNSAVGGENSTVTNTVTGSDALAVPQSLDELHNAIADLGEQIRAAGSRLPNGGELAEITDQIGRETAAKEPNGTLLKGLLQVVRGGVSGITTLAPLVSGIEQAVKALLGIG